MYSKEIQASLNNIATYEDSIKMAQYWVDRKDSEYIKADTNHRRYLTREANKAQGRIEEYKELIAIEKALIESLQPAAEADEVVEADLMDIILTLNSAEMLEEGQGKTNLIKDLNVALICGTTEDNLEFMMKEVIRLKTR